MQRVKEVYLVDLKVRTNGFNPEYGIKSFLESKGIEVIACNGYVDPDHKEEN